jgi:hypothetical protein
MKLKIPDGIEPELKGLHAYDFGRWMDSVGIDSSKPFDVLESEADMCWYIRQSDEHYHKWIGDEYE